MISRTLGPEFGGSIGTLFYFANVVSCALYLAACTEGLVNNFGPNGSVSPDLLPSGFWWNFAYATAFNGLNLVICLIGSKWFGRTTVLILSAVVACMLVTSGSFFQYEKLHITFEDQCFEPSNQSLIENCTEIHNGSFIGLSKTSIGKLRSMMLSNLYPR